MGSTNPSGPRRRKSREFPLYQTIRNYLIEQITSGELKAGDKLPSEMELAAKFGTTRVTVVHALQKLVFEQLIVRQAGKGSFVSHKRYEAPLTSTRIQSLEGQLKDLGESVTYKFLQYSLIEAEPSLAAELRLQPNSKIFKLERLRLAKDLPISFEVRFVPHDIGKNIRIGALDEFSFIDILQEQLGLKVARIAGSIASIEADRHQSEHLDIPKGAALLAREYVFYSPQGQPISKGLSYYRKEVVFRYETVQSED